MLLIHSGVPIEYTRELDIQTKIDLLEIMNAGLAGPVAEALGEYQNYVLNHVIIEEIRTFKSSFSKSARYRPKKQKSFDRLYPYHANMFCKKKSESDMKRDMGEMLLNSIKQIEGLSNASGSKSISKSKH